MKERKLTPSQVRMLRSAHESGTLLDGVFGQSAHGGADGTRRSLLRRKLIVLKGSRWRLTKAGRLELGAFGTAWLRRVG
jgi:hypothetical protein